MFTREDINSIGYQLGALQAAVWFLILLELFPGLKSFGGLLF